MNELKDNKKRSWNWFWKRGSHKIDFIPIKTHESIPTAWRLKNSPERHCSFNACFTKFSNFLSLFILIFNIQPTGFQSLWKPILWKYFWTRFWKISPFYRAVIFWRVCDSYPSSTTKVETKRNFSTDQILIEKTDLLPSV